MRALHLQSGIPVQLWPLILNAAIKIPNVTPNEIAPKSPYYAVYHRLPDIKRFYSFGCRAYRLDADRNNLNSKAKVGIYVGTEFSIGNIFSIHNLARPLFDGTFELTKKSSHFNKKFYLFTLLTAE
ncbi:hypothetical protein K3495_g12539 [Podosphaera aphanis]|nr:hypothetical protein K3495_g12539 [Podosphaera aphanis]